LNESVIYIASLFSRYKKGGLICII